MANKKTCNNCKALSVHPMKCDLGYKILVKIVEYMEISAEPLEICPKPITNIEYVNAFNNRIKRSEER